MDAAARSESLEALLRSDRERGLDVTSAPLSRVTVVRLADEAYQLVWTTHHLYVDGWSWPLIFRDVGLAYEARREGGRPQLPSPCQYSAYIEWLRREAPDSRAFWTESLAGFTSPTPLPYDGTTREDDRADLEASALLDAPTTAALQALARALRVTPNVVVQGSWAIVLGHLSARDDVVFGAAFSGRPAQLAGVETLVGPCVNNLPIRVRLEPERKVSDWLRALHERNQAVAQHQYAPLSDIQQWAGLPWRDRLFDSLLVFQNYQVNDADLSWGAVDVELLQGPDATNYPLTLNVMPSAEMGLKALGRPSHFGPASLSMIVDAVVVVLQGLVERSESSVAELQSLLPASTAGMAAAPAARPRQAVYVAPGDEVERAVAEVWEELFEVDQVGTDDNFFDLGGHSILLLQAHARLRERFGSDMSIVELLQYPTVRSLARHLKDGETSTAALEEVRVRAKMQRQALAMQRRLKGKR